MYLSVFGAIFDCTPNQYPVPCEYTSVFEPDVETAARANSNTLWPNALEKLILGESYIGIGSPFLSKLEKVTLNTFLAAGEPIGLILPKCAHGDR